MISFSQIFKQAFFILRNKKFVWGLGLFLFWNLSLNVLSYTINTQSVPNWRIDFGFWSAAAVIVLVLIFALLFFRARAGLIFGIKNILEKKYTKFSICFREGGKFQLRLFTIWLATSFFILILGLLLAAPVAYLYSVNLLSRATMLGIFALAIFVPVLVIANFVSNLAALFVVFFDLSVRKSINASLDMIRKFWVLLLLFTVFLSMLTFVFEYIMLLIGSRGLVFLSQIFYNTAGIRVQSMDVITGIGALVAFLILAGAVASYQQICWTLLFEKFVRAPKTEEEEETAPAPEVIS